MLAPFPSARERATGVGPREGLGQDVVDIVEESQQFTLEVLD
jgi:hypothetical protein